MRYFWIVFSILMIFLCGCQSITKNTNYYLQKNTQVQLPLLSSSPVIDTQQLLHISTTREKLSNRHVLTLLSLSPERLTVILLSPLGIKLAQLEYDGQTISVKHKLNFDNNLPPFAQIIGDILLTTLPLTSWQLVLPAGWKITEQNQTRIVFNDKGQAVVRVDYVDEFYQQAKQIQHYQFHYQILLEHLK